MQVEHNVPVGNFLPFPSVNAPNSVPPRDPRLQINGLVNEPEEHQQQRNDAIKVFEWHDRFYYYTTHNNAAYPFPIDKVRLREGRWMIALTPSISSNGPL